MPLPPLLRRILLLSRRLLRDIPLLSRRLLRDVPLELLGLALLLPIPVPPVPLALAAALRDAAEEGGREHAWRVRKASREGTAQPRRQRTDERPSE